MASGAVGVATATGVGKGHALPAFVEHASPAFVAAFVAASAAASDDVRGVHCSA